MSILFPPILLQWTVVVHEIFLPGDFVKSLPAKLPTERFYSNFGFFYPKPLFVWYFNLILPESNNNLPVIFILWHGIFIFDSWKFISWFPTFLDTFYFILSPISWLFVGWIITWWIDISHYWSTIQFLFDVLSCKTLYWIFTLFYRTFGNFADFFFHNRSFCEINTI